MPVLEAVRAFLWGWPLMFGLVGTGLFLTIRLRGLQFHKLGRALWMARPGAPSTGDGAGDISNFQALMTALSATVGTGNIADVATAVRDPREYAARPRRRRIAVRSTSRFARRGAPQRDGQACIRPDSVVRREGSGMGKLVIAVTVGLIALAFATPACAEEAGDPCAEACPPEPEGLLPVPEYGGCWYRRPYLAGDWGGVRGCWADRGVFLDLQWTQVAQGVIDGGFRRRWGHTTNLDLRAMFDLTRMGAVPGALVSLRAQSRFGDTVNGDSGLLLPVHTYGYFPYTDALDEEVPIAITELNWLQMVSDNLGFLVGKITTMTVANEFASGEGRTQFMNFQFIFPSVFAQVAPYSTLAGGVVWMPSPNVTVSSILLNTADSSTRTGFDDFDDGQTWWTSATCTWGACSRPGGVTLGAAYAFNGDFARIGGLSLDPGSGISVSAKSETWAVFATGWQYLVVLEEPRAIDPTDGRQDLRGLGLFAVLGVGDEDTNPVRGSIAVGLSGRGLIPGRCDDTCGLAYFYNELGDPVAASRLGPRLQESQGVELYYGIALTGSIGLTLDAQWADSGLHRVEDAFLLGARLNVDF